MLGRGPVLPSTTCRSPAASPSARGSPRRATRSCTSCWSATGAGCTTGPSWTCAPAGGLLGADVVFPVLHGPFGEDGTVQGLLELLDVPYVGSGVLASALCMDKILAKDVMAAAGLPQVRYVGWRRPPSARTARRRSRRSARSVCPCSSSRRGSGSSVGIAKVDEGQDLVAALEHAFAHDPRVIVEAHSRAWRSSARCSATPRRPRRAHPGQIVLHGADWYDYEAKYQPGGMELRVPAEISDAALEGVRRVATEAFRLSGCSGLARVDFFVEGDGGAAQRGQHDAGVRREVGLRELWDAERPGVPAARGPAVRARRRAP